MDAAWQAARLKALLIEISPLIEEYTSTACPDCLDVCCKQKRSLAEPVDVRYLLLLGLPLPIRDPARDPEGRCQFMGDRGCTTVRWRRPWRCTWYFCAPLLDAMRNGPQRKARRISALIQQILDIRSDMI